MSKAIVYISLFFSVTCLGWLIYNSQSKEEIVYANTSAILADYNGTKESQAIYQNKVKTWQSNLDTLVGAYKKDINRYETLKGKIPEEEQKLRLQLLERQEQDLVNYKNSIEKKIEEEEALMTSSVIKQVNSYIKEYGKEKGYKIILGVTDDGSVLYGEENDNITKQLIEYINKKHEGI